MPKDMATQNNQEQSDKIKLFAKKLQKIIGSRIVRALFMILALAFLALVLRSRWQDLRTFHLHIRPGWLALSYIFLIAAWLLEITLWRTILAALSYPLPIPRLACIQFISNLIRYIPGNIWQFLGMMELAAADAVPRAITLLSVFVYQVFSNLAGIVVGLYLFKYLPNLGSILPVIIAFLVILTLSSSLWLPHVCAIIARFTGKEAPTIHMPLKLVLVLFCGSICFWTISGIAFFAFSRALGSGEGSLLAWISSFAGAYVAGYLSLLTPSGLGVREGVMTLLLGSVTSPGSAAFIAVASRLWLMLGELLAAGLSIIADRQYRRRRGS